LLDLPDNPYPTDEREEVTVGKTPYVRFDCNDYSVPPTYTRRILTVLASPTKVRILDGGDEIACHARNDDKAQQIENPEHLAELVQYKHQARHHRGQDRLVRAAPNSRELLTQAASRGHPLGSITAALLRLLDRYGATELEAAIDEALSREVPHPNAVHLSLERRREERQQDPPVEVALPPDQRVRNLVVRAHPLCDYDGLKSNLPSTTTPSSQAGDEDPPDDEDHKPDQ